MRGKRDRGAPRGRRGGVETEGGAAALGSFLGEHGYPFPPGPGDFSDESIVSRLSRGPVPPAYLLAIGARCSFPALPLIEEAVSLARAGAGLSGASGGESRRVASSAPDLDEAFALLTAALGEERPGQVEMARAVRRALEEGRVAILEAGTGTGKSLAYLVPSVLHSLRTGERIIVSTHTKNLQDQLFRKETPLLEEILAIDARAERLLGRDNYLCSRGIVSHASSLMDRSHGPGLAFALYASLAGEDGTLEALGRLPAGLDARAIAAPPRCPMNACGLAERCPLLRARARAREAGILFVNHALLFTDLRQGGAVIGPYSRVIFDEAHHLERCVIENLSVKASRDDIYRVTEPLRLRDKDDDAWRLLVHELSISSPDVNGMHLKRTLAGRTGELEDAFGALFRAVEGDLNPRRSLRSTKTRYTDGGETFANVSDKIDNILFINNELNETLKLLREMRLSQDLSAFQQEMGYVSEELSGLAESLRFLAAGQDEESVFWLDWGAEGALREICGSPLGIDRPFADYLESILGTAVFTSATLSQNGSFAFFKERLGLRLVSPAPIELIVPSPFPFEDNCLVLVVSELGDPNDDGFGAPVGDIVAALAAKIARRTMVLFTSYRLCFSVAGALERALVRGPVLVQGAGESREALSARFRRSASGILLGVASFWEGVDFPGEELEVLVIPKIPFPVPSEPIVEARAERLAALGEEAFGKLFLPEAILRMRQGAGRLIRRMNDRGVIVILDSRLGTRPYAGAVLSSLPSSTVEHVSADECVERAAQWFAAGAASGSVRRKGRLSPPRRRDRARR